MSALPRLALIAAACSTVAAFANPTDIHPSGQPGNSYALAVSGDGTTIVGYDDSTPAIRAFSKIGGAYAQLALDAGGSFSEAAGV